MRGLVWHWRLLCVSLALSLTGCSDAFNAGPLEYVENEALTQGRQGQGQSAQEPGLAGQGSQGAQRTSTATRPSTSRCRRGRVCRRGPVPGELPPGGRRGPGQDSYGFTKTAVESPTRFAPSEYPDAKPQAGGYAVYRRNCLHCHGVSGAGDGPTAPFLYPIAARLPQGNLQVHVDAQRPSPHRDDLRRTIKNGLHGTSMPAFHSLLTEPEIEQVIDYVIFLSMRGETESLLIEEGVHLRRERPERPLGRDRQGRGQNGVFNKWKLAQTQIVESAEPADAVEPARAS